MGAAHPPVATPTDLDNILNHPALAGMRTLRQWIVYVAYPDPKKPGKLKKEPMHHTTGYPCDVTNPANWTDAATAVAAVRVWGASYGVGFCFTKDDPYWFLDLDSCLQSDRTWSPLAQQMFQVLAGAALEISVSVKGLHMFGRGTVPPHAKKNAPHGAELYTEGRFCAMTGTSLQGNCDTDLTAGIGWVAATYFPPRETEGSAVPDDGPCPEWNGPTDDKELLRRAMQSRSTASAFSGKASFADLWLADADVLARTYPPDSSSSEPYDRSGADRALAQHLAFWCGKDVARIERLMRQSQLYREKWDDHDSYLVDLTIRGACAQQKEVLQDKPPQRGPDADSAATTGADGPQMTPVIGATFLRADQQRELFAGCVYVRDQHRVLVPDGALLKPEQFRATYGGYSFLIDEAGTKTTKSAFEAFTESQVLRPPRADGVAFKPQLPFGKIIETGGRKRVNTYKRPTGNRKAGDVSPFLRHLELVLPVKEDREILLYWMAHVTQSPGVKSNWMPLLYGNEGNGKTVFSLCLQHAVGAQYVHWPKASELGNKFNAWLFGKVLVCIEDLKIETSDVWEKLKPMITGEHVAIEQKGVDERSDEVCASFIANTNHDDAAPVTGDGRRVCPLWTAQKSAFDLHRDSMGADYFARLYGYLKSGGYDHVSDFLHTLQIPPAYDLQWFQGWAPKTSSTGDAIEATMGKADQAVLEAVEEERVGFRGGWISSHYLKRLMTESKNPLSRPQRAALLKRLGYVRHPALEANKGQVSNVLNTEGCKPLIYVKTDHPAIIFASPAAVAAAYEKAQLGTP